MTVLAANCPWRTAEDDPLRSFCQFGPLNFFAGEVRLDVQMVGNCLRSGCVIDKWLQSLD